MNFASLQPKAAVALILLTVAAAFPLRGATIVCTNLIDSLGVPARVTRVTFTPVPVGGKLIPQAYGNQTVLPQVVGANCDTNSAFSATILAGGIYTVTFLPSSPYVPPVNGLVPSNTNAVYTLNQIIAAATNQNVFGVTNIYGGIAWGSSNGITGSASIFFYLPTNNISSNNYPHGIINLN